MAHVPVPPGLPGIVSLFAFRPETAKPLSALAEVLLRGPSSLSRGERELIATVVSTKNDCTFCGSSHAAFAAAQLEGGEDLVAEVRRDPTSARLSAKMRSLLAIAQQVQVSGKAVTDDAIASARAAGATDIEIHDAVLIAAAFCMFNRYVDGLATLTPQDPEAYRAMAQMIVEHGYIAAGAP